MWTQRQPRSLPGAVSSQGQRHRIRSLEKQSVQGSKGGGAGGAVEAAPLPRQVLHYSGCQTGWAAARFFHALFSPFHSLVLTAFCECVLFYFSTLWFHSFTLLQLRCAHPYASLSDLTVADCVRPPQMLTNSRPVSGSMDCQD